MATNSKKSTTNITIPVNMEMLGRWIVYVILGGGIYLGDKGNFLPLGPVDTEKQKQQTSKMIDEKIKPIDERLKKIEKQIQNIQNSLSIIKDAIIKKKLEKTGS